MRLISLEEFILFILKIIIIRYVKIINLRCELEDLFLLSIKTYLLVSLVLLNIKKESYKRKEK